LVLKIKKNKKPIKIGHTGTLDKAAEGLLILPFGDYTAFSSVFLEEDKGYFAKVRFGKSTDSGDRDGNTVEERSLEEIKEFYKQNLSRIKEEILKIKETTSQIPPVISAIKVGGMRQSSLYRGGIEFESVRRSMKIYQIEFQNLTETGFEMSLRVSSGTYIRKIVMDLGESLGFPMFMESLVRTSIGSITLEKALSVEDVILPDSKFYSLSEMLPFPWLDLNETETKSVRHGGYVHSLNIDGDFLLRDNDGNLLAWCSTRDRKKHLPYKYLKVFYNPDEI
jgi:tRNA pseudouridine55 synthase